MSESAHETPEIKNAKKKVYVLFTDLKAILPEVKLGHCYNFYAHLEGYKDWNVMFATLKKDGQIVKPDTAMPK